MAGEVESSKLGLEKAPPTQQPGPIELIGGRAGGSPPVGTALLANCNRVNRLYYSRTNGISGGVVGVDGSLNGRSTMLVLQGLHAKGRVVMDMGCGDGRFMAAALAGGARKVVGCELPDNHAQLRIFNSVLGKMARVFKGFSTYKSKVKYLLQDIDKVLELLT